MTTNNLPKKIPYKDLNANLPHQIGFTAITLFHVKCVGPTFQPRCIIKWIVVLFFSVSASFALADVTIEVSDQYSAIQDDMTFFIEPMGYKVVKLPSTLYNDKYIAEIKIKGGSVRATVIDNKDISSQNPKYRFLFDQTIDVYKLLYLPASFSEDGISLILHNSQYYVNVEGALRIYRVGTRPPEVVEPILRYVEIPLKALASVYTLPNFKVKVQPCGLINAYSTPDVIICTELIADLWQKELQDAMHAIILHELAHTLLYLWGLPGYDNEDLSDEFAATMLAKYSPDSMNACIKWLESKDSVTEAVLLIVYGDHHTISIQRARNMREKLSNPEEIMVRWGRLLGPFRKR